MGLPNRDVPRKSIRGNHVRALLDEIRTLRRELAASEQSIKVDDFALAVILSSLLEDNDDDDDDNNNNNNKNKNKGGIRNIVISYLTSIPPLFFGAGSLEDIGKHEKEFKEIKETLLERTKNLTVVATLAVSATVAFLTTAPPTPYAAWDKEFPYLCIALTCGCGILSAGSGLGLIMYLGTMTRQSVKGLNNKCFKGWAAEALLITPSAFLIAGAFCACLAWLGAVCAHCGPVPVYSLAQLALLLYHNTHLVFSGYLGLEHRNSYLGSQSLATATVDAKEFVEARPQVEKGTLAWQPPTTLLEQLTHVMVKVRSILAFMCIRVNIVRIVVKGALLVPLGVFMVRSTIISGSATTAAIYIFDSGQAGRPWHLCICAFSVVATFLGNEDDEFCTEMAQNQGNQIL
ncbi:hypothetical protein M404DRAFT_22596 [Pisolithus tinctorius Marx 270]|uniref:Uncharacterized protein n=1 Tax=Pisolithus tinctorius Marx 270 TaxID=870435 RepID=A0A0C3PJG2_PISTI|nr:hypothetical protein M404DRAFT_22596 [Pisolithus tinctorius Marx 270]